MDTNNQITELQYKDLTAKGYTTKQIALQLNISQSKVKYKLRSLGLKTKYNQPRKMLDKIQLEEFISKQYSFNQIARELHTNSTNIKYWCKIYWLISISKWGEDRKKKRIEIDNGIKTCPKCNITKPLNKENFYIKPSGGFHYWCKICSNAHTVEKIRSRKQQLVIYKGGKCCICGYNKYVGALDFHHLDPSKKDYNISNLRTYDIKKLMLEADKCICVCRNCHSEIHAGMVDLKLVLRM